MEKNFKAFKLLVVWFIMGMVYFVIEGVWRIPKGGYANIVMLPIGGLCGMLVGSINQIPKFYCLSVWKQALAGTAIVLIVEYISGYILNVKLGLNIWDYSNMRFNLNGQICPQFALIWYLIMPLAIWFEDFIRFKLWNEEYCYCLKDIYLELILFK